MNVPVVWKLTGKAALVVGGGIVALRKTESLLAAGALVTVISPEVEAGMLELAPEDNLSLVRRCYEAGDANGSWLLVVAATDSPEVNRQVAAEAKTARIPVCMVDDPANSDFIFPAVLKRGKLLIAVSTSGAGPGVAAQIRDQLGEIYGNEYEMYLDFLHTYRLKVQRIVKAGNDRRLLLRKVTELDIPALIRSGQFEALRDRLWAELDSYEAGKQG